MGLFAAFAVLALLNTAVCYALYRLAAFFQQKHWEQSTIGGMPDLPKLRHRFFIFFLLSLLLAAWFVTSLADFPAQR